MTRPEQPSLARLGLGAMLLVAERLGVADRARTGLAVATGLAEQVATGARTAAEASLRAAASLSRTGTGAKVASRSMPSVAAEPLRRVRAGLRTGLSRARRRGEATLDAGRAEALTAVRAGVDDAVAWAQANVVPRVVNGLVPQLVDEVVPRVIDGVLPRIRLRVLPVVIEDLTTDPRVRDLVREQGRGVLGDAAEQIRTRAAAADDQLEARVGRMFRGGRA